MDRILKALPPIIFLETLGNTSQQADRKHLHTYHGVLDVIYIKNSVQTPGEIALRVTVRDLSEELK